MADLLRVETEAEEDRFARFRLISWWDQARLGAARVLVIGAGALGNEILKNLALLGIGNVFVADLDRVANSNLSRSVLFREADCGRPKVEVVADRAREIYPAMKVQPFFGNIVYDLGLGIYRWADVILGGLDNREARVAIKAEVRTRMSAGVPSRNLAAIAPTAPNSPAMPKPVSALNFGARLTTRPWAAPPLRMFKSVMSSTPLPRSGCRA